MNLASCTTPTIASIMSISEEDYRSQYWPQLQQAVQQLLTLQSGEYAPVSFEQVYSCTYKCVCNQFSGQLLTDLRNLIRSYLNVLYAELKEVKNTDFIARFDACLQQYTMALQHITTVFTYLNRSYVETKLHMNLHTLLLSDFTTIVVDPHVQRLVDLLTTAHVCPFKVEPSVRAQVITNLHALNPDYTHLAPHLFATYIPNVLPPMCEADIPTQAEEIRFVQEQLAKEGYSRKSAPLKRTLDISDAPSPYDATEGY